MSLPAGYGVRQVLMDPARLSRTLSRMAHEIAERHADIAGTALVGVRSRGVPLARRLAALLKKAGGAEPRVGALDITLYRDDFTTLAAQPILKGTEVPFPIEGSTVVLVDDVLYTGRTIRGAIEALFGYGRPHRVQLAVLVDRGHRELPIRPDYVGKNLPTARSERVNVQLSEVDQVDRIVLLTGE